MVAWGLARLHHNAPACWSAAFLATTKALLQHEAAVGGVVTGAGGSGAAASGSSRAAAFSPAAVSGVGSQALANTAWAAASLGLAPDAAWLQVGNNSNKRPYCHTAILPCYHTAILPYCHSVE